MAGEEKYPVFVEAVPGNSDRFCTTVFTFGNA
jgi:hypothetical protein